MGAAFGRHLEHRFDINLLSENHGSYHYPHNCPGSAKSDDIYFLRVNFIFHENCRNYKNAKPFNIAIYFMDLIFL